MAKSSRVRRALIPLVLAAATITGPLAGAAPASPHSPQPPIQRGVPAAAWQPRPLDILLTNDDGYSFPFVQALRQALTAAGHKVTIVAPAGDSSGGGTGVNFRFGGTIRARQVSPGVWSVDGSPGDAVYFGLRAVYRDRRPDLVVSGPNAGQNVGALVNHSGTVGATIAALDGGVPAVAFSTAVDITANPPSFPSLQRSIAFAVRVVDRLSATSRGGAVLPPRTALNVNYPLRPSGEVSFAGIGTTSFIDVDYAPAPDQCADCHRVLPVVVTAPDPDPGSDRTLLDKGHVTITPLDGDWEAPSSATAPLRLRLAGLKP
ncbi:5'/3'-nucleotidase SurE [Bailinhaonella thermotolerans]|uniref:5'-nucleotidase n=1 Tax=Bailinhaonella thermotolerans TaxID=1070861 RepID=A0A3A4A3M9_9ACTN|nr:5'/3'-nucleotidase SurE [Bailinhaonella thermotolerans]RJL21455.1 hypothetical protein D5H75_37475 [Bailinhaonella thermotolerans]